MVYRIVMENDNQTIKVERNSLLVAIAKARVWSQEGWNVVVTDSNGNVIEASEFDRLLAA